MFPGDVRYQAGMCVSDLGRRLSGGLGAAPAERRCRPAEAGERRWEATVSPQERGCTCHIAETPDGPCVDGPHRADDRGGALPPCSAPDYAGLEPTPVPLVADSAGGTTDSGFPGYSQPPSPTAHVRTISRPSAVWRHFRDSVAL